MGWLSFFSIVGTRKRRATINIGLETGLFQQCPVCREITEMQASEDLLLKTEQIGEQMIAENDPRVAEFKGDKTEFSRLLRKIKREADYLCLCERN